jgi:prevent-host-death family protein
MLDWSKDWSKRLFMKSTQKTVGAYEAKTKLPELLERAAAGEIITITKHNQPIARLVPARTPDRASLDALFKEMDDIRERSPLNPPGKPRLSIKQLIEEGRK